MSMEIAFDDVLPALFRDTAERVRRIVRGEETPVPKPPYLRTIAPALTSSSRAISRLRLVVIGHAPDELRAAAVTEVGDLEEAAQALAVELAPDAVVVSDARTAEKVSHLTTRPVIIDDPYERPMLRARIRHACAAASVRQIREAG